MLYCISYHIYIYIYIYIYHSIGAGGAGVAGLLRASHARAAPGHAADLDLQ